MHGCGRNDEAEEHRRITVLHHIGIDSLDVGRRVGKVLSNPVHVSCRAPGQCAAGELEPVVQKKEKRVPTGRTD